MSQANNETPAVLADFLGGIEAAEPAETTGKRKGKPDFAALLKAGKLTEDMLDPWNEEHHEWINKVREADAKQPVWIKPKPNDNEFYGPFLYAGVNGRDYYMPVNRWSRIPRFVLMHLQSLIKVVPIREWEDQQLGKFIGYMETERFPYDISETEPKLTAKDKPIVDLYR